MNTMNTLNLKLSKPAVRPAAKRIALGLGLLAVGTVAAIAASAGGPFSAMNNFCLLYTSPSPRD